MSYIKRWIDDVFADYEDGKTVNELAKKYKVSKDQIEEVIRLMSNEEES